MKLTNEEMVEAREALQRLSLDKGWQALVKHELAMLDSFKNTLVSLNEPNYAIMQAFKQGTIASLERLHKERQDLLNFKGEKTNVGSIIHFKRK